MIKTNDIQSLKNLSCSCKTAELYNYGILVIAWQKLQQESMFFPMMAIEIRFQLYCHHLNRSEVHVGKNTCSWIWSVADDRYHWI